jgi:hypothetical protein
MFLHNTGRSILFPRLWVILSAKRYDPNFKAFSNKERRQTEGVRIS